MTRPILHIYETLRAHPLLRWALLAVTTALLALMAGRQSFQEDIADFLPLDEGRQQALQEYQNTVGARRIYVIFQLPDSLRQTATELFTEVLEKTDTAQLAECLAADDPEVLQESMTALYARIPYLLTPADYARMDSMAAEPGFVTRQLADDKQRLMLPTAGMTALQIQHDPLNLFTPVLQRLKPAAKEQQAILLTDSPFGASETEHNTRLVDLLQQAADSVCTAYPEVSIRLTGGPVIAVGNARQIKTDSIVSIAIASCLILLLLWRAFHSLRSLLLIALSIGWGWLFAMGCLTVIDDNVSLIVIGISSVILGIAVNYPLHLIAHLPHTTDIHSALKEIAMPLLVGNVTTVGAFLTLVPLRSVALRDLGLFSAFLLIGTILFVLIWLPHIARQAEKPAPGIFGRIGSVQLENKPWLVWAVVALTLVLGCFSWQTTFDADLRNINYMTDGQRQDMQQIDRVASQEPQTTDLTRWNEWRKSKGEPLCRQLRAAGAEAGFAEDSFDAFCRLIASPPADEGRALTADIVSSLSDNFNYIGWACGFIVFFFLWFSLGSIELALLSFLPMAVSWVWILGLMALLDIQFNVVNIILATFIFGQGDDYTIFMTEGCQYEYAFRRKMLGSYKYSIILSALIMFIGIGALITAKHPALFSLAEVTVIGMFSVVLMACLFPPLIFRWLVYDHGKERQQPVTLRNLVWRKPTGTAAFVADCYRYRGMEISTAVNRRLRRLERKDYPRLLEKHLLADAKTVLVINGGWGETLMFLALRHPQINFISIEKDPDKSCVARIAAENRVSNVSFADAYSSLKATPDSTLAILLEPTESDRQTYAFLNPATIEK